MNYQYLMIESSSVLSHQINHNIRHCKLNPFLREEKRERGRKGEGEKSTHMSVVHAHTLAMK